MSRGPNDMPFRRFVRGCGMLAAAFLCACTAYSPSNYDRPEDLKPGMGVAVIRVIVGSSAWNMNDLLSQPMLGINTMRREGSITGIVNRNRFAAGEPDFFGEIHDGLVFVVLPATQPGERYAVSQYRQNRNFLATSISLACQAKPAATFEIGEGQVRYVGDYYINIRRGGQAIYWDSRFVQPWPQARQDILSARPALSSIEPAPIEWWTTSYGTNCHN